MRNEFQCTQRVCHTFEEVALSVGEVIHRVSLPGIAGAVVRVLHYTIDDRVAEVHIGAGHINLGTEHHLAFLDFAGVHLLEQSEAFFDRTVAVWAFCTRLGRSALLCGDVFRRLFVDVSLAFLNQADGKVPQLLEVIGCIIFISPLESEPLDVFLDGFHVFHIFFGGVGIVKAEVAYTAIAGCDSEIQADGLGVSDVEVSVWLGRESCLYAVSILTFAEVFLYSLFNEVQTSLLCHFVCVHFSHIDYLFLHFCGAKIHNLFGIYIIYIVFFSTLMFGRSGMQGDMTVI